MKKQLFLLATITLFFSCKQDKNLNDSYEIIGTVVGVPNGVRAYLKSTEDPRNPIIIDTSIVRNEEFTFTGTTDAIKSCIISINSVIGNLPIILENGKTNITIYKDSINSSIISGPKNNQRMVEYRSVYSKYTEEYYTLTKKMRSSSNINSNEFLSDKFKLDSLTKILRSYPFEFINKHKKTDFSLLLLETQISDKNQDINEIKKSLDNLKPIINKNQYNKKIAKKISNYINQRSAELNLEIGKIAPKFSSPDKDGKMIALDDIKGKVTIIDFWAAWCGPCRRENPNVVKVYEKYHDKGLEIIGVSLDGNRRQQDPKAAWLKAIEDDKLTWHHVSSLQYFNDPVARLYSVNSIPRTFILDEQGRIVAKNLRGKALEDKIAELLN